MPILYSACKTNSKNRTIKKDPFLTAKELRNTLGAAVTARTIRNRLIERDMRAYSARKVPSLSQKNMKNILLFAKQHQNRQNWNNVLWSDETKINMCGSDGKIYVMFMKFQRFFSIIFSRVKTQN